MVSFEVNLSLKGKTFTLSEITTSTTGNQFFELAHEALALEPELHQLKILYKGKKIQANEDVVFETIPKKAPKLIVMVTEVSTATEIASKRSDPTIRGFVQEQQREQQREGNYLPWGPNLTKQDKHYKFCKIEECLFQSFGHRPTDTTPHAFQARQLLEKLATDPGVVAVMQRRELVVNTLGEMDPIDDRIMQKKQQTEGACLLGYNTNGGLRIDIKLRTDDLKGFRPYPDLVGTLLHELSHNWVGEHNLLFWTNYAQMRAEYLFTHARLTGVIVDGTTTANLAGLNGGSNSGSITTNANTKSLLRDNAVQEMIMQELESEMAQHGLHPLMIQTAIQEKCREMELQPRGQRLGTGSSMDSSSITSVTNISPRERALAAAERRAKQQQQQQQQQQHQQQQQQNQNNEKDER